MEVKYEKVFYYDTYNMYDFNINCLWEFQE